MELVKNWKSRTEVGYGRMGMAVAKHPWLWLLGAVTLTALLATQLLHLRTDTSIEGFLLPSSDAIVNYDSFRNQFGADEIYIITVEVDDIFDPTFIEKFRQFHDDLADNVPYVDSVDSLINARHTYGKDNALIIEELLEELPNDPQELSSLKEYTYNNPQFQNYLISSDRHLVSVMIKLTPFLSEENEQGEIVQKNFEDSQLREVANGIEKIVAQYQGVLSEDIRIAGSPTIGNSLNTAVTDDFSTFSVLAILIVGFVLYVVFRRLSGVLMPLAVMILGVTATISSMAFFNSPMQMTTSILPSFLMAVCVGDSIHLLTIFYRHYDSGVSKTVALCSALEHTGLAMFFTSITTAASLASFALSDLSPIANLGIYGAMGALIAFMYTVLMLPCLIVLLPLKRKPVAEQRVTALTYFINFCVHVTTTHPIKISVFSIVLFIATLLIALQLEFSMNSLLWFDEDHPVRLAVAKTEARMGGTMPIEVIIDTGIEGGATNSALLKKLDTSIQEIELWESDVFKVAKVVSLTDIIKETHRALNDNNNDFYSIPDDDALIRQELFLVEMDAADQLFQLTDSSYRIIRCTILVPWVDAINYSLLIERVKEHFANNYREVTDINVTGLTVIMGQTFTEMLFSTAQSYLLASVVITIMMIILLGSFSTGLVSMLPNLLPITMVLALMNLMNMPLDMFTLLIGSIAIGLTVDDTVHFMHGFRRAIKIHGDSARAVSETLHSTGRAMLVTSVVLSLGFLIYTQSTLNNLRNFGVLTALCIALALLSTFLLAPALMMLMSKTKKGIDKDETQGGERAIASDVQASTPSNSSKPTTSV